MSPAPAVFALSTDGSKILVEGPGSWAVMTRCGLVSSAHRDDDPAGLRASIKRLVPHTFQRTDFANVLTGWLALDCASAVGRTVTELVWEALADTVYVLASEEG